MAESLFVRMLKKPRTVGAVAPSSAVLARELVSFAEKYESVIELGAGTGPITRVLVEKGFAKLEVVEIQPELAAQLRRTHPELLVNESSAADALDTFVPLGTSAIVSSLPFRSLPSEVKSKTISSILRYLSAHQSSRLVQYTYGISKPFEAPSEYTWTRMQWVLRNLPPACIWVLAKSPLPF